MNRLEVRLSDATIAPDEVVVGSLVRATTRTGDTVRFAYDASWLDATLTPNHFPIDPTLPLHTGDFHPPRGQALQGVFLDLSPDRWGRVLMERREAILANDEGRPARALRDWDFLVGVNDATRMGGLRLWDTDAARYVDAREPGAPPFARLRELEAIVANLERDGAEAMPQYRQWVQDLVLPGTSLGGARPKASFAHDDGSMWLAKFPAANDRRDVGLLEFLATELARRAGVHVPPTDRRRFSERGHTFMARRFDREAGSRRVFASAMTLLEHRDGDAGSYLELAALIEAIAPAGSVAQQLEQLYRRVLLSIVVGNRDDHWRNHGFLRLPGGWVLSPAFDLNPNPDRDIHAIAIDEGDPRPVSAHLRATAAYYRLTGSRLDAVEREVRDAVRGWPALARSLAIGAADQGLLATTIDADR